MAYDRLDRHAWTREHPTGGDLGQQVERHTYDRNGIDGSNGYGLLYQSLSYDSGATNSTGTWTGLKRNETFDARGRTTQTRTWIENNAGNRWWWRSRQTFGPANQTQTITYPNAAPSNATPGTAYEYDYNQNTGLQQRLTRLDDGQVIAKNANYNPRRQLLSLRLDAAAGDLRLRNSFMPSTHWLSDTKMGDNPGTGPNDYANVNRIAYGNLTNGGYDPNGNVLLAIDYNNAVQRQCYEYDHLDRLVTAYTDNTNACNGHTPVGDGNYNHTGANSYGYDEIGNITAKPGQGTYTYGTGNAGPHAVTATSNGNTYTYDDAGNTITRPDGAGTQTLDYDLQNQLETITGTVNAEFHYDTTGIRTKRDDGDATTWYPSNGVEYKRNNTSPLNPTSTHWLRFNGTNIAYSVDGTINYVLADKVSSTSAVYDTATSISSYQRYQPFGTIRGTQTVNTDTGYTGQRTDQTTGLNYYISRYYDPELGRFTKPDSLIPNPADGQSYNRYTYVHNNPTNYNDPTGHDRCADGSGGCGGVREGDSNGDGFIDPNPNGGCTEKCNEGSDSFHTPVDKQRAIENFHQGVIDRQGAPLPIEPFVAVGAGALCGLGVASSPFSAGGTAVVGCGVFAGVVGGAAGNAQDGRQLSDGVIVDGLFGGLAAGTFYGASRVATGVFSKYRSVIPRLGSVAEELAVTRAHLATIDGALEFGPNRAMLSLIDDAAASGRPLTTAERNFLDHELLEASLVGPGFSQEAAHILTYETVPIASNYSPAVIRQFPHAFSNYYRNFHRIAE